MLHRLASRRSHWAAPAACALVTFRSTSGVCPDLASSVRSCSAILTRVFRVDECFEPTALY
jgi:hypothetical protein